MMTFNEKYVQEWIYGDGYTWDEIGMARLVGVGMGLCINRSTSILRDYWAKKVFRINKNSSETRKNLADLALASIIIPTLYTLTLGLAGESREEILQMVPSGSAIQMGMAFLYMKCLDKSRKLFGTTPDYLLEGSSKED